MTIDTVLHTNEQSINRVLQTGLPVVLVFWSQQAPLPLAIETQVPQPAPKTQGSDHPVTLTDANFAQMINSTQPVLVDFWAPWCGPCRMVAPVVEQLAREFQGRAIVGKLNVDENPRTAQQYQIMGIPALYIFKQGKVVDQMVGVQPANVLQQRLARQLN